MNKKTTIKRQLMAGSLLLVFLFITAAKVFHSHENVNAGSFTANTTEAEKSPDCSICDYHFTQDAEVSFDAPPALSPFIRTTTYFFYKSNRPSSIGLSYADRGPPSLT